MNDPPSFTGGGNLSAYEDQSYSGSWASSISPGPGSEAGQSVSFSITSNTNSALFSAGPAISNTGVLSYTPAANLSGSAEITVVLQDNGGTENGGDDASGPYIFIIIINAVNDAPSFNSGGNVSTYEDVAYSASWAGAVSPGPADEAGQSVAFSFTANDNPSLFQSGPTISPAGTLSFTPTPNSSGVAHVKVVLQDNGGTANGGNNASSPVSFTITVTNINDEPTFTAGGNITVAEDSGGYSAPWASAILAGPPDESGQMMTFYVNTGNHGLFSTLPAIAANGALTFEPAANQNGIATVSVFLVDDGGTANGGDDTSPTTSFTITVTAVNDAPEAYADTYSTKVNTPLSISPSGVMENDIDIENDRLTATLASNPSFGALVFNSDGSFTYTPLPNAFGSDTFTYYVRDHALQSAPASVTITVVPTGSQFLQPWNAKKDYRWVMVREGISTKLTCTSDYIGTIITLRSTGDGIALNCLNDATAKLNLVEEDELPHALPAGFEYISGLEAIVSLDNEPLELLEGWLRITFVEPKDPGDFRILFWDETEEAWLELPSVAEANGTTRTVTYEDGRQVLVGVHATAYDRIDVVLNFPGLFILVAR